MPKTVATPITLVALVAGIVITVIQTRVTDFPIDMVIYREGVKAFLEGREVYSEPMMAGDIALPFIYPPFGALVMVPLTAFGWMTDNLAGDIMIWLSNLLVLLCVFLVLRGLRSQGGVRGLSSGTVWMAAALTWALMLLIEPVRLNNSFAQINIVVMTLVVLDLVPRKRLLPQGWLIGIAAAIKLTPLAMLLYFLIRKDFRAIVTAAASAIVATAVAAAVRWDVFVEFFTVKLLAMGSGGDFGVGTAYQSNSSIKAVLQRAFSSQEAMEQAGTLINVAWLVLSLAVIGLGGWAMAKLIRRDLHIEAWLIGAIIMLLISPVSWSHHWVWLALIVPVFSYRAWMWRHNGLAPKALLAVMIIWLAFLLSTPPKWWFGDAIDVFGLNITEKFLVSDFVWLAAIAAPLLCVSAMRAEAARAVPAQTRQAS